MEANFAQDVAIMKVAGVFGKRSSKQSRYIMICPPYSEGLGSL
jgi:hypothetical protein